MKSFFHRKHVPEAPAPKSTVKKKSEHHRSWLPTGGDSSRQNTSRQPEPTDIRQKIAQDDGKQRSSRRPDPQSVPALHLSHIALVRETPVTKGSATSPSYPAPPPVVEPHASRPPPASNVSSAFLKSPTPAPTVPRQSSTMQGSLRPSDPMPTSNIEISSWLNSKPIRQSHSRIKTVSNSTHPEFWIPPQDSVRSSTEKPSDRRGHSRSRTDPAGVILPPNSILGPDVGHTLPRKHRERDGDKEREKERDGKKAHEPMEAGIPISASASSRKHRERESRGREREREREKVTKKVAEFHDPAGSSSRRPGEKSNHTDDEGQRTRDKPEKTRDRRREDDGERERLREKEDKRRERNLETDRHWHSDSERYKKAESSRHLSSEVRQSERERMRARVRDASRPMPPEPARELEHKFRGVPMPTRSYEEGDSSDSSKPRPVAHRHRRHRTIDEGNTVRMKIHEIVPSSLGREPPIRPVSPSMLLSFQATPDSQKPTWDTPRKDIPVDRTNLSTEGRSQNSASASMLEKLPNAVGVNKGPPGIEKSTIGLSGMSRTPVALGTREVQDQTEILITVPLSRSTPPEKLVPEQLPAQVPRTNIVTPLPAPSAPSTPVSISQPQPPIQSATPKPLSGLRGLESNIQQTSSSVPTASSTQSQAPATIAPASAETDSTSRVSKFARKSRSKDSITPRNVPSLTSNEKDKVLRPEPTSGTLNGRAEAYPNAAIILALSSTSKSDTRVSPKNSPMEQQTREINPSSVPITSQERQISNSTNDSSIKPMAFPSIIDESSPKHKRLNSTGAVDTNQHSSIYVNKENFSANDANVPPVTRVDGRIPGVVPNMNIGLSLPRSSTSMGMTPHKIPSIPIPLATSVQTSSNAVIGASLHRPSTAVGYTRVQTSQSLRPDNTRPVVSEFRRDVLLNSQAQIQTPSGNSSAPNQGDSNAQRHSPSSAIPANDMGRVRHDSSSSVINVAPATEKSSPFPAETPSVRLMPQSSNSPFMQASSTPKLATTDDPRDVVELAVGFPSIPETASRGVGLSQTTSNSVLKSEIKTYGLPNSSTPAFSARPDITTARAPARDAPTPRPVYRHPRLAELLTSTSTKVVECHVEEPHAGQVDETKTPSKPYAPDIATQPPAPVQYSPKPSSPSARFVQPSSSKSTPLSISEAQALNCFPQPPPLRKSHNHNVSQYTILRSNDLSTSRLSQTKLDVIPTPPTTNRMESVRPNPSIQDVSIMPLQHERISYTPANSISVGSSGTGGGDRHATLANLSNSRVSNNMIWNPTMQSIMSPAMAPQSSTRLQERTTPQAPHSTPTPASTAVNRTSGKTYTSYSQRYGVPLTSASNPVTALDAALHTPPTTQAAGPSSSSSAPPSQHHPSVLLSSNYISAPSQANINSTPRPSSSQSPVVPIHPSPVSRHPSQDSILKTPSSLTPSVLKQTPSRTSLSASMNSQSHEAKKKGFLGLFKSKTAQPSQYEIWKPPEPSGPRKSDSKTAEPASAYHSKGLASRVKVPPPVSVPTTTAIPNASRKSPAKTNFTPFKLLAAASKRNRTVSAASAEAVDGTAPNTVVGSPTASMHSQTPLQVPPPRDPMVATREWREQNADSYRKNGKKNRPGVVFELAEEPAEDRPRLRPIRSRGSPRGSPKHSS
ncbi:uncharacterized protein BT62DRAFT_925150 [Guyanagaster necrorhizus]|uniref:Uncharacterized protein n=1 Tax=Guyanagaster necrorhizus TaxID=856835 RepID=A0A9P7W5M8_9AGAR|nr:uncharacterized protein BT62DRAFT_925150 [Guyanagaster necrorhizus MCA 3950]KAG7452588.1 hypothetical protein BT62DRAFT_925150 [Guyanagaster necrorhizus MCA 3950]